MGGGEDGAIGHHRQDQDLTEVSEGGDGIDRAVAEVVDQQAGGDDRDGHCERHRGGVERDPGGCQARSEDFGGDRIAGGTVDGMGGGGESREEEEEGDCVDVGCAHPHHQGDRDVGGEGQRLGGHQQTAAVKAVGERAAEESEADHPQPADGADCGDHHDHVLFRDHLDPGDRGDELEGHHALSDDEAGEQQSEFAQAQRFEHAGAAAFGGGGGAHARSPLAADL